MIMCVYIYVYICIRISMYNKAYNRINSMVFWFLSGYPKSQNPIPLCPTKQASRDPCFQAAQLTSLKGLSSTWIFLDLSGTWFVPRNPMDFVNYQWGKSMDFHGNGIY